MVYEIQQPSDITYRLDDWGRVDAQGNPREVHLDAGFEASRPELMPEFIEPVPLRATIGERHLLTACRYFALERFALPTGGEAAIGGPGSPAVVTVLSGEANVGDHRIIAGRSAVVWPTPNGATLVAGAPCITLVSTVPNIPDLVRNLERLVDSRAEIAALAGPTGDLSPGHVQ
jgi:mannose-6-phosphate isomerase